jgi:hypothetical protein
MILEYKMSKAKYKATQMSIEDFSDYQIKAMKDDAKFWWNTQPIKEAGEKSPRDSFGTLEEWQDHIVSCVLSGKSTMANGKNAQQYYKETYL